MRYARLFEPGSIGSLHLRNRLIHPPIVRNFADGEGRVTPRYVAHLRRIAQGGVGAIIVEATFVAPGGKGFVHQLGIHTDQTVPGLRRLVAAVHAEGARIGIQLFHGGRQASQRVSGSQPVAPSPIADPVVNEMPRELTVAEIRDIVDAFAAGARRAKRAGFDFIELHGAHGYLICQFLSPFSNHRTDQYGGTPENRLRFLDEVVDAVRGEVGAGFPVIVRLSGDEYVDGGLGSDDTVAIARHLERRGIDALHISAGNYASFAKGVLISPMAIPDAPLVHLAVAVTKAVSIPVIAVNKIRTPALAEETLRDGAADFIALGRSLLADPDWPIKAQASRDEEIMPCVACNQECIGRLFAQRDIGCTVNPAVGRERAFAKPTTKPQRVMVIGGGPAGLEAAIVAATRGHSVTLYEQGAALGGQLHPAAVTPFRADWGLLRDALVRAVRRLKVDVRLGSPCTPESIPAGTYDVAIVATGSTELRPTIPGPDGLAVVTARAVLEGRESVKGRVVVAGGGCMGAQTAEHLAARGHAVTIVEALSAVAADAPVDDRALLLGRLAGHGVEIRTDTRLIRRGPGHVVVQSHGDVESLPADTLVLCLGATPVDGIVDAIAKKVERVIVVGDAKEARKVPEAMVEGALAALAL